MQPLPSVTVTVYVPLAETVMFCVVSSVLQEYELAALDESVTLPPVQNVVGPPAVMVGVGLELTVIA
ncbi:MAG: hypothetical protein HYY40_05680 [Bacteroidetes bacterium]|nr:hypothetical protein [Bacteroidota bacterium]